MSIIQKSPGVLTTAYVPNSPSLKFFPYKISDISNQFDGIRKVFTLKVAQSNISKLFSTIQATDIQVRINGNILEPYIADIKYPWISEYSAFTGYKLSGSQMTIYTAPKTGSKAFILITQASSSKVVGQKYPFSASTLGFGD